MKVEFLVSHISFSSAGEVVADGVCAEGVLRVGDDLRELKVSWVRSTEAGMEDAGQTTIGQFSGRVLRIEAYGKSLEELDRGVSARVVLAVPPGGSVVWAG